MELFLAKIRKRNFLFPGVTLFAREKDGQKFRCFSKAKTKFSEIKTKIEI